MTPCRVTATWGILTGHSEITTYSFRAAHTPRKKASSTNYDHLQRSLNVVNKSSTLLLLPWIASTTDHNIAFVGVDGSQRGTVDEREHKVTESLEDSKVGGGPLICGILKSIVYRHDSN